MAIAEFTPVLSNQKKQCCKIARFTDAPCIKGDLKDTCKGEDWIYLACGMFLWRFRRDI
jgi:hypothetical protein